MGGESILLFFNLLEGFQKVFPFLVKRCEKLFHLLKLLFTDEAVNLIETGPLAEMYERLIIKLKLFQ